MLSPDDSRPPPPQDPAPETPFQPDADPTATAAPDDGPIPLLPGDPDDTWPEGEEGESALVAAPAPSPASEPANLRAPATAPAMTRSRVDPVPSPEAPGAGTDSSVSSVLMKSLPVVRTAQRDGPTAEAALQGIGVPGHVPPDRRAPVAASVVLICAALAAHALVVWRRRTPRYWAA
jgi:hypothetical protein